MKKAIKSTLGVAAGAVALAGVASIPALVSAWGDSMGGRPEYTIEQINNGDLGDTITFNSISDGDFGHEFNFVGAREDTGINAGADNLWNETDITVENGKTYIVRMYVHNNNPNGRDAVAKDVKVAFNIPQESSKEIQVDGFINSSNATPTEYWDDVVFKSDQPFHLEYVQGSANIENRGVGSMANNNNQVGGRALSDDIVKAASGGTPIGYDSVESGEIPGCYEFSSFIGIKVKVVYDTPYTITKSVRPAGTKGNNWTDQLEANVGDEVEYQIDYVNTSSETQRDVVLRDSLPDNIEYIPGTTRLWNENYSGATYENDNLFTDAGINIGAYGPEANGYVRFNAKVVDENLDCGSNTLVNWAQGWVGDQAIQDYANVHLNKVCETPTTPEQPETPVVETTTTPTALPTTGPEAIAGAIVGTGSIVTAAGYYVASRRSLK